MKLKKKTKEFIKEIGIVLCVAIAMSLVFGTISKSCKSTDPTKTSVDSIQKINDSLIISKDSLDSIRVIHLKQIDSLTMVIDTIESKVKIVRVYYNKKAGEVAKYTPGELDTFFKLRYNY